MTSTTAPDEQLIAHVLGCLSPHGTGFGAAAQRIAELRRKGDSAYSDALSEMIRACQSELSIMDWKISTAGYVFGLENLLLKTREIAMNVDAVLEEFSPDPSGDDEVLRLDAKLTHAIARHTPDAMFVSLMLGGSDQYVLGAIAATDADDFEAAVKSLGFQRSVVVHRPQKTRTPKKSARAHDDGVPVRVIRSREPNAPRDNHPGATKSYWDEVVAKLGTGRAEPTDGYAAKRAFTQGLRGLIARYSRGDALPELALAGREFAGREVAKWGHRFQADEDFAPSHSEILRMTSLLVLSKATAGEAQVFADIYARWASTQRYQGDRVVDTMLRHLGATIAKPAKTVVWPAAFHSLWRALAPTTQQEDRAENIHTFLKTWHRKMYSECALDSQGRIAFHSYLGHWCVEAAAAVVVARIEDDGFENHQHFPRDLAAWAGRAAD